MHAHVRHRDIFRKVYSIHRCSRSTDSTVSTHTHTMYICIHTNTNTHTHTHSYAQVFRIHRLDRADMGHSPLGYTAGITLPFLFFCVCGGVMIRD